MSDIINGSISIYEALKNIQDDKYVMPAFQRQYVWNMEQIEKLWDSILLDYPIATFLFWHLDEANTTNDTNFCTFLTNATFNSRKQADSKNYDLSTIDFNITDTAILDGQQRLTSLYLCLLGDVSIRQKHTRRNNACTTISKLLIELNKNKLTIDEEEYNSKKFDVRFTDKIGKISPTQFEIKKILNPIFKDKNSRAEAIENEISNVPKDSQEYARNILNKLCEKIYDEELIRYTKIQGMKQDDALEMFVRFNSGGKPLRKSDITMSILEAYWHNAKAEFGKILTGAYVDFDNDFIIRTALMLYGDVLKSNINKKVANNLQNNWEYFKDTLKNLEDVLNNFGIDIKRFASSWNVLLPIIYCIYYNPEYQNEANLSGIKAYLIRAILFTYFQSGTTSKLQQMKNNINENNFEITIDMLEQMNELRVTEGKIEDLLIAEKGSRVVGDILYFVSRNWLNKTFKYEIDHLHPYSRFDQSKPPTISIEKWKILRSNRNRLPNLHLLEGRSNGSKNDMSLQEYYDEMNNEQKQIFYKQALIPENTSLGFEFFEDFYNKRKEILSKKIKELLY